MAAQVLETAKKHWKPITGVIGVLVIATAAYFEFRPDAPNSTSQKIPSGTPVPGEGIGAGRLDEQQDNLQGWSCATINNPALGSYQPSLPIVVNAFRAVEQAGDPHVWEPGPYMHIDNGGRKKFGDSWDAFSRTYNGEHVCVGENTQSRLPQHQVVFRKQFRKSTRR